MKGKQIKRTFITEFLNDILKKEKKKWPKINSDTYLKIKEELNLKNNELSEKLTSSVKRIEMDLKANMRSMAYYLSQNPHIHESYKKEIEKNIEKVRWELFTISDSDMSKLITNLTGMFLEYINFDYYERGKKEWDFDLFRNRPKSKVSFGQLFCTPDTSFRRIELIMRDFSSPDTKVLFLGDDDLCSIALKSLSDFKVHMLDLDRELIKFIDSKNMGIKTRVANLKRGIPKDLQDYFDAVMIDPFWDLKRTEMFLEPAIVSMKKNSKSKLYISICPFVMGKDYKIFQQTIIQKELIFSEIIKHFSYYIMTDDKGGYSKVINLFKEINKGHIKNEFLDKALELPVFFSDMHILSFV